MGIQKVKSIRIVAFLVIVLLSLAFITSLAAVPEPILVDDINPTPGVGSISSNPFLSQFNNSLLFVANDGLIGDELWKAEQTTVSLVKDIALGPDPLVPFNLVVHNGLLYFTGNDNLGSGEEPWISNGTESGTLLLKDINPTGSSNPSRFTSVGETLFFQASDGVHGSELWKTDGTTTGTIQVKDIYSGTGSSSPILLTDVNGTLFFVATDDVNGKALWKSDGTPAGTVLVKDILPGAGSDEEIGRLQSLGNKLFFRANDGIHGVEPWISDGTPDGTQMVEDIYPGADSSNPTDLAVLNDVVFFRASDGSLGEELWKSDGTDAGTALVKDISPGSGRSDPGGLTTIGQVIYFAASDGLAGRELWKTDGTGTGTQLVKDINPNGSSGPILFTDMNGIVFFRASDGVNGAELWVTSGTEDSTLLVKDIYPGESSSNPADFVVVQDLLYFTADDGLHGRELWALNLDNLPPEIVSFTLSANPVQVGNPVNAAIIFSDPDQTDTHTATIDWADGTVESMSVDPIARSASASHMYSDAGTYSIRIAITDAAGAVVEATIDILVTVDEPVQQGKLYLPLVER